MIMVYHGWSNMGRPESVPWRPGTGRQRGAWHQHTIVANSIPTSHALWWVSWDLNVSFEYLIASLFQFFLFPVAFHLNCQDDDDEDVYAGEFQNRR